MPETTENDPSTEAYLEANTAYIKALEKWTNPKYEYSHHENLIMKDLERLGEEGWAVCSVREDEGPAFKGVLLIRHRKDEENAG